MANRILAVIYQGTIQAAWTVCAKHAPMKISRMSGLD